MKKRLVLKVYLDPERDADILAGLGKFRKPHRGEFVRQAIRAALLLGESTQSFPVSPPRHPMADLQQNVSTGGVPLDEVFG